jgi:peptidoglycan pentaglycine glycine transferase (the first glycine)
MRISAEDELVVCRDGKEAVIWDEFLSALPEAHIEQTVAWGELKRTYGWNPLWIWVRRGSRLLGGAMLLTRRLGHFMSVGYVERGPVWDRAELYSAELVNRAVCDTASSLGATYLVIVPPYSADASMPLFQSLEFRPKPELLPPTGVGRATLLIDLSESIEKLFAGLSMTKRQNIRKALRKGGRVRIGDGVDADTVRDLMWAGCQRRNVKPSPPQLDFFDNLWRLMNPFGGVKFFLAEIDGKPVASAVVLVYHGRMQLYRVGWTGTHAEWHPNDLLHWEMLRWGHENGCHTFDFMHIKPQHARALLNGEKVKDSFSGITEFKTGFGGALRLLPEVQYRSYNPLIHFALNLGAAQIFDSPICERVLRKTFVRFERATQS